ncbi:MAG: matrixin family metalloprotease [Deltaproteobacteria bacterium]|nr:matrixin family metalloprotease [Deltaproteobacteria bacterium]
MRLPTSLLFAFGTALAAPSTSHAWVRSHVDGEESLYLYWPSRTITVALSSQGSQDVEPGAMRAAVMRSLTTWSANACTDLYVVWGGLTASRVTNLVSAGEPDRTNALVWREEDWPDFVPAETLALTTLVYDNTLGAIIDGDIDFNGAEFFWTATDDESQIRADVQNTVTHELGHLIGLDHSDVPDSTMFFETEPAETKKRDLDEDDLDALCFIYPTGGDTPLDTVTADPAALELAGSSCAAAPGAPAPGASAPVLLALALVAVRRRRR